MLMAPRTVAGSLLTKCHSRLTPDVKDVKSQSQLCRVMGFEVTATVISSTNGVNYLREQIIVSWGSFRSDPILAQWLTSAATAPVSTFPRLYSSSSQGN